MDAKEALERLYPAMQDAHVQRSKFYAPRGPVKTEADADNDLDLEALSVLRAVVDDRDALKAEVERLNNQHWVDLMELDAARKAEAELAKLRENYQKAGIELLHLRTDLAAARPLMDAAMNYHPADGICLALNDYITIEAEELFGAALAYRSGRAK